MKNNNKSVRLSDRVFDYINGYPEGDGFNQKFENIVLFAMESERERRLQLEQLERDISIKVSYLHDLSERINKVQYIDKRLEYVCLVVDELVKEVYSYVG